MVKKLRISFILLMSVFVCNSYGQYNFQADIVEGCDSLIDVNFLLMTPAISDSILLITWDLEGAQPPFYLSGNKADTITVSYNNPGSYRVFVNITFNLSDTTINKNNYINVNQTVSAEYSYADTLELIPPYSVVFRDITTLFKPDTYYDFDWDFGDGTIDSGRVAVHTFPGANTYNVILTVTDSIGCSNSFASDVVVIEPPPPYEILASETESCDSLYVKFTFVNNTLVDTITTIFWDFGNGETSNSFDPDTVVYYPGIYSLNYILNGGTDNILLDTIKVYRTVSTDFIYSDTSQIAPYTLVFRDITALYEPAAAYNFDWDFDDGDTGTGRTVIHTFPGPAEYNVSLTISNSFGCTDTHARNVTIAAQPYEILASETEGCDSLHVKFTFVNNTFVDTVSSIDWDFGNGETSNSFDPDTVVYYPGIYSLNYILNGGTDNILRDTIKVYRTVSPEFVYSDTSQIAPNTMVLRDITVLPEPVSTYSFDWDFDDDETGTGRTVIHTFPGPDTYDVSLTVIDSHSCSGSQTSSVFIAPPGPEADITASANEGCDSLKVKFSLINVDPDTILSVSWDFGNEITSSEKDPDTVIFENSDRAQQRFEVTVIINGDSANAIVRKDLFTVYRTVRADFRCADTLTTQESLNKVCWNIDHLYNSSSSYEFIWTFEGFDDKTDRRPLLTFPSQNDTIDAGLTITDLTHGCTDTYNSRILLTELLEVQNFFSPNDDNIFDEFIIDGGNIPLHIMIYSRTGTLVYEARDSKVIRWNGTTASGHKLKSGVYFYILKAVEGDPGERFNKIGFVHLFR